MSFAAKKKKCTKSRQRNTSHCPKISYLQNRHSPPLLNTTIFVPLPLTPRPRFQKPAALVHGLINVGPYYFILFIYLEKKTINFLYFKIKVYFSLQIWLVEENVFKKICSVRRHNTFSTHYISEKPL